MFENCISIAKDMRLKTSVIGDWYGDGGRTLYIGSAKSAYRMRIYEKGKQDDNASIGGVNWVRFELVCRPDKNVVRMLLCFHHLRYWVVGDMLLRF